MKVLLCHPNQLVSFDGVKARPMVGPPLGLLLVAAYLREAQPEVSLEAYDARVSAGRWVDGNGDHIFGDTDAQIRDRLQVANPDIIGISNMFSAQVGQAYRMADIARAACPEATVVIGGPHVSVYPLEAIERESIDWAVMGEGEKRFAALVEALSAGMPVEIEGVVGHPDDLALLRSNPRVPISFIAPLDELPLPAYDLIEMDAYFELVRKGFSPRYREWGEKPISMITSRGCPHRCVFCSIQTTMGYKFRAHSVDYVAKHIRHLVDEYGVDFIHFEDDNFTHVPERYDSIIDFLVGLEPGLQWDTPNGVRGDTWTRERVRRARQSGCQFLTVAVESAVQRVLDEIVRKRLDLDAVDDLMRFCNDEGLRLHAFYIIGFPGETLDEMQTTVEYALDRYRRFGVTPFLQPLIPIPGTDVYKQIVKEGLYVGELRTQYNQVRTDDFNPDDVQRIYKEYLRKRLRIFARRTLTSAKDFTYNVKLVATYPQAVVHAIKNARKASG
ncbi:MAG: B12-binding domain-containing radical SAM protein [bacterium]|nr:B12-binding domain-containing radical SAM protein [bacterium]